MTHDAYKAWLDAMPIDDVQRKIERLEHKVSDLRVFERVYAERHPSGPHAASEPTRQQTWSQPTGAEASAEPAGEEEASSEPTVEEASAESGSPGFRTR